jgi:hypothetical protein
MGPMSSGSLISSTCAFPPQNGHGFSLTFIAAISRFLFVSIVIYLPMLAAAFHLINEIGAIIAPVARTNINISREPFASFTLMERLILFARSVAFPAAAVKVAYPRFG